MKKLLISIGSLLIMACVVILFVNAEGSKKDPKKAKTETVTTKDAGAGTAACCQPGAEKAATSDGSTTAAKQEGAQDKTQSCDPMASCAATCGAKAPVKK